MVQNFEPQHLHSRKKKKKKKETRTKTKQNKTKQNKTHITHFLLHRPTSIFQENATLS